MNSQPNFCIAAVASEMAQRRPCNGETDTSVSTAAHSISLVLSHRVVVSLVLTELSLRPMLLVRRCTPMSQNGLSRIAAGASHSQDSDTGLTVLGWRRRYHCFFFNFSAPPASHHKDDAAAARSPQPEPVDQATGPAPVIQTNPVLIQ